jgi:hypothetical protein
MQAWTLTNVIQKVVVTDGNGNRIAQASLSNDLSSFHEFFSQSNEPVKAVVEACRTWESFMIFLKVLA